MSLYAVYMHTLGNRPDLFPNGTYPNASTVKEPTYYDIPPEALEDATFAAMMAEAEKYVGYPYVWGGSSPSTSFDCSGFVSWVINHSGWDVGRLGAQGLCNICTPVSPEQAKARRPCIFRRHLRHPRRFPRRHLCGQFRDVALWRPHFLHQPQFELLAAAFLLLRASALTPERSFDYGKQT